MPDFAGQMIVGLLAAIAVQSLRIGMLLQRIAEALLAAKTEEVERLRAVLTEARKRINDTFGGMSPSSAIWSNNPYCKGHTAGVLAALTAFDAATRGALATKETT